MVRVLDRLHTLREAILIKTNLCMLICRINSINENYNYCNRYKR